MGFVDYIPKYPGLYRTHGEIAGAGFQIEIYIRVATCLPFIVR